MSDSQSLRLDPTRDRPLWEQVVTHFERLIEEGALQEGDVLPNHPELARRVGVGQSTLQKALSRLCLDGWICRVPRVGTTVASPKQSASKENGWIAVMTRALFDPNTSRWDFVLQQAISKRFQTDGRDFRLYPNRFVSGENSPQRADPFLLRDIEEGLVQGLFVCGHIPEGNPDLFSLLKRNRLPRLEIGSLLPSPLCDIVSFDGAAFMNTVFDKLVQADSRSVGLLRVPLSEGRGYGDQFHAYEFLAGYHKLKRRPEWEITAAVAGEDAGVKGAMALLESGSLPEALIITDDVVAKAAMEVFAARGVDIPGRLSVYVKGNLGSGIRYALPVSTIDFDPDQLVGEGLRFLSDRIEGSEGPGRRLLIAPQPASIPSPANAAVD